MSIWLAGCASPTPAATVAPPSQTPPPTASYTPPPSATPSPLPSATSAPSATPAPQFEMCSPLEGLTLAALPEIVTQPFDQPRPGLDDGHHGVDFAYYRRGERIGITGLPVYSALNGRVVVALQDKLVYGNAVLIETPLQDLPPAILQQLSLPTPAPTVAPPNLSCPTGEEAFNWQSPQRSLYLIYAHLNQPPQVKSGDAIRCGQQIGEVGNTGRSGNPHLHLETRIGPAGAPLTDIDHYFGGVSPQARAGYCAWRVSGLFQIFDPMRLLSIQF